jgi:N-acetylglucosaminyl-diphospho-decaprenol L-rhamnosyltransferase
MASPLPETDHDRVGVVTVSYGSQDVLGEFLASVSAASAHAAYVIVTDNLPSADSPVPALVA